MATTQHINPAGLPTAFGYERTDIPPGLTIQDWRSQRAANAPVHRPLRHPLRTQLRRGRSQLASAFAARLPVSS